MKRIRSRGLLVLLPVLFTVMMGQILYASSMKLNPPLTNAYVHQAQFTPDSQNMIYRINYLDDNSYAIYRVPVSGGDSVQLSPKGFENWFTNYVHSISPNGEYMVFRSNHENFAVSELYSVPVNGVFSDTVKLNNDLVEGGNVAVPDLGDMRISPTSDRVAYTADQDEDTKYELYSVPIEGPASAGVKLNATLLPTEDVTKFQFTPDGQYVIYMAKCENCGSSNKAIFSVPSAGPASAAVNLTSALDTGGNVFDFKITPDSEYLVYKSFTEIGFTHLYKVPVIGGSDPMTVTTRYALDYNISRDGNFIVFNATPASSYVPELYRVPFASAPLGEIKLNHDLVAGGMVLQFAITPDSSRVVYHASDTAPATFGLFTASINGLNPIVKLNDFPIYSWGTYPYRVTNDGQYVIYMSDDRSAIYRAPIMGPASASIRLTMEVPAGSSIGPNTVTSDNRTFVYVADAETADVYEFFRVPFTGPVSETVKINGPMVAGGNIFNIGVSPNGRYAYYLADEEVYGVRELFVSEIGPALDYSVFLPTAVR